MTQRRLLYPKLAQRVYRLLKKDKQRCVNRSTVVFSDPALNFSALRISDCENSPPLLQPTPLLPCRRCAPLLTGFTPNCITVIVKHISVTSDWALPPVQCIFFQNNSLQLFFNHEKKPSLKFLNI